MSKHTGKLLVLALMVLVGAIVLSFFIGKSAQAPSEQLSPNSSAVPEQISEPGEGETPVMPDINTQEFRLTASNVSCSTSTINGVQSRSCSGNIRVIPRAQTDMEPGLFKINERTKLLHAGTEQDLNTLQQLAQSDTTVRLKLATGSEDTLAEIHY